MKPKRYICLIAGAFLFLSPGLAYSQGEPIESRFFKTDDIEKVEALSQAARLLLGCQTRSQDAGARDGFLDLKGQTDIDSSSPWLYDGDFKELIRRFVEPVSWSDARTDIVRVKRGLLIKNTRSVLDKLGSFFNEIREGRRPRVRVLTSIVELRRKQGVAPVLDPVAGQFLNSKQSEALKLALKSRGAVLLNAKEVTAGDGDYRVVKQLKGHSYLAGFPIYQGGTVPVNEAENGVLLEGLQVQLRVSIPRDRSVAQLDCLVERCKKTGMRDREIKGLGTLQLPQTKLLRVASSFHVPASESSKTMVLATFSSESRRSQYVVLVKVETLFKKRSTDDKKSHIAFPINYYRGPSDFELKFPWGQDLSGPDGSRGSNFDYSDGKDDVLKSGIAASSMLKSNLLFWNRCLLARGPHYVKKAVKDWLALQAPTRARYSYRLIELEVENAAVPDDHQLPPEKVKHWLAKPLIKDMAVSGYLGQQVSISQHSETRIFDDVEHATGGTGKEIAEVAYPNISSIGRGQLLVLRTLSPLKSGVRVKVKFQSSDYESLKLEDCHGFKIDTPQKVRKLEKMGVQRILDGHGLVLSVLRGEKRSRVVVLVLSSLSS